MLKILRYSQFVLVSDVGLIEKLRQPLQDLRVACFSLLAVSPTDLSPLPDPVLFPKARKNAAIATIHYLMAVLESRGLLGRVKLLDCLPSFPRHLIPVYPPFILVVNPRGPPCFGVPDDFAGRLMTYIYDFNIGAKVTSDVSTVGFRESVTPIPGLNLDQSRVPVECSMAYAIYAEAFMWSVSLWRR